MIPLHICMSLKSKVWSMSYHGSVGDEFKTETQLYVFIYFVGILLLLLLLLFLFSIIKFAFLLFSILFLDEASNFRYRILTNQKQKFVVENCQWKCMSQYFLNWNVHCVYYVGLTSFGIKKQHARLLYNTIKLRYQTNITIQFSHKSQ